MKKTTTGDPHLLINKDLVTGIFQLGSMSPAVVVLLLDYWAFVCMSACIEPFKWVVPLALTVIQH